MFDPIGKLINYDPIAEAEKHTGTRIEGDHNTPSQKFTTSIAFQNMREKVEAMEVFMKSTRDTTFNMCVRNYKKNIEEFGFKLVLNLPFSYSETYTDGVFEYHDHLYIHFYQDFGLVLSWDTYHGKRNSAKLYFNWRSNNEKVKYPDRGSGSLSKDEKGLYFVGDIDGQEAIRYEIKKLVEGGELMREWGASPFLWLLHHQDTKDKNYDFDKINKERISMLPIEVQNLLLKSRS